MATTVGLVPVHDVREPALGPAPRWARNLSREYGAAGRNRDRVGGGRCEPGGDLVDALPVEASRRRRGAGEPVQAEIVEDLFARQASGGLVGPCRELLPDPGGQPRR